MKEKYKQVCKHCSNEFECFPSSHRLFCNMECYSKHRKENENYREVLPTNKCKTCDTLILQTRVYCKECWKQFVVKPRRHSKMTTKIRCQKCNIEKTLENTFSPEPGVWSTTCRKCHNKISKKSKDDIKQMCINYKGGCCRRCGYKKCIAALDFHHKDPTKKDFSISQRRGSGFTDELKIELDKCILLCANCHREEHYQSKDGKKIKPALDNDYDSEEWF